MKNGIETFGRSSKARTKTKQKVMDFELKNYLDEFSESSHNPNILEVPDSHSKLLVPYVTDNSENLNSYSDRYNNKQEAN